MDTIKDRVKALCDSHGMTVAELEKALEFGNGTIAKWDSSKPRAKSLAAVAVYFGIPVESLKGDFVPEQKEIPAAISNEEYQDAILRGQNSYFLSLFQRLTPAQKDQTIAEILQKLQSQQVQDEQ